jgi:sodium transport system permease protein
MVIIPLVLFPMIFVVASSVVKSNMAGERARKLVVGVSGSENDLGLRALIDQDTNFSVVAVASPDAFPELIRNDSLDLGVMVGADFAGSVEGLQTGNLQTYYLETKNTAEQRFRGIVEAFEQKLMQDRLDSLGLQPANITPLAVTKIPVDTKEAMIGQMIGGFIPYMLIIFCFMGCMFPAIDLFTGEKERGSIETILSTPVERWKILVGKMSVLVISGMMTAILSLLGILVGLQLTDSLPQEFLDMVYSILSPGFVSMFLLLLFPLAAFFAGVMVPITVYAKSFKEASSMISPLNFIVIMPAVVGMMPGVELNFVTAVIPVLNVVLATKSMISNTLDPGMYLVVLGSLIAYASVAVAVSFRRFGNEKNVLRS